MHLVLLSKRKRKAKRKEKARKLRHWQIFSIISKKEEKRIGSKIWQWQAGRLAEVSILQTGGISLESVCYQGLPCLVVMYLSFRVI